MPEDSLNEAINLANGALKHRDVIPAHLSTKRYVPGVPITNQTKEAMVEEFKSCLSKDGVTFAKNVLTLTNKRDFKAHTSEDGICKQYHILKVAKEQLSRFRKVIISNRDRDVYDVKYTFSGKECGLNDDLAVAILMIPFWSRKYEERVALQRR